MVLIVRASKNIVDIVKIVRTPLRRRAIKKKKAYIDSQKQCCAKCGDTRVWVLDFHHKDRDEKEFTIGKIKKGSLDLIQSEIDKCAVLCANCHREFHYLEKE